jgi:tetratricopeptide (TPR) repeat protein
MGDAFLRLRKYKDAIEALEKVLELSRPEDVIYEAIGHCYHRMHNYGQARYNYKKASHLNTEDSKLYYKVAVTYMLEGQWLSAMKQLENALKIHRNNTEYNLAMGECLLNLNKSKEAINCFSNVVRNKPKSQAGWEALIRCLIKTKLYEDAASQCIAAMKTTNNKPIFTFYYSAILFFLGKSKEGLLQLESVMEVAPKLVKKLVEINPSFLQNNSIVELIRRYKKNK